MYYSLSKVRTDRGEPTCVGMAENSASRSFFMSPTSTGPTLSGLPAKLESILSANTSVQSNTVLSKSPRGEFYLQLTGSLEPR